jgi:hypothetical protein
VIEVFGLSLPLLGGNPPYFMPLLVLFLAFSAWAVTREQSAGSSMQPGDGMFILAMVVWTWLETANGLESGGLRFDMLMTNIWCFFVLMALRMHTRRFDLRLRITEVYVELLVAWSLVHVLLFLCTQLAIPPLAGIIDRGNLVGRNGFSHLNCLGILLLLFELPRLDPLRRYLVYLPILCSVLAVNGSRGATMIAAALVMWRLTQVAMSLPKLYRLAAMLALIVLLALSFESIRPTLQRMTTGLDFDRESDVMTLSERGDDYYSAYARNKSNILVLESIAQNPLSGVGAYGMTQIRAARYQSHTYWLYPLGAYGFLGAFPYVLWFISMWRSGLRLQPNLALPLAFFLLATMTFTNDMYAWYGLVFFLVTSRSSGEAIKELQGETRTRALRARFHWIRGTP